MSVYTPVSAPDLDAWLLRYAVGGLAELAPIASGIENTNYFVTTERGRYVLTLYERLPASELPFYLNLMARVRNEIEAGTFDTFRQDFVANYAAHNSEAAT